MNLMTSSRLKSLRLCQRMERFQYRMGMRPVVDAEALVFGTLVHKALEAWWNSYGLDSGARLGAALTALDDAPEGLIKEKVAALIAGYHHRWIDEPFKPLAVEVEFKAPLINPLTGEPSQQWNLGGKLDAIVRDTRDGLIYILEHKTSSEDISLGSAYWQRLQLDSQISIYFDGAKSLGYEIEGCIYDVIGKPKIRQLKANSRREEDETVRGYQDRLIKDIAAKPSEYYQRGAIVRLEQEMVQHRQDIWAMATQLSQSEVFEYAPRNPDSCWKYGRPCSFWGVCSGSASIDDPNLFKKTEIHPELTQAKEATT